MNTQTTKQRRNQQRNYRDQRRIEKRRQLNRTNLTQEEKLLQPPHEKKIITKRTPRLWERSKQLIQNNRQEKIIQRTIR